jgi:hypothetical protein
MNHYAVRSILRLMLWMAIVMFVYIAIGKLAHGEVSEGQHRNTFGALTYTVNPYMYEAVAEVIEATNVDDNLNLRIKPIGTYMLFDEQLLICGLPVDRFRGMEYPYLITVERVSHHSVGGVGCHDLVRVNEIVPDMEKP